MSKVTIELTERMEQDRKNCCEDLCANDKCSLYMEEAEVCLLELIEGECKHTNADKIRAMADEELADFLMDVSMGLLFDKQIMNVKKWLQSEVGE